VGGWQVRLARDCPTEREAHRVVEERHAGEEGLARGPGGGGRSTGGRGRGLVALVGGLEDRREVARRLGAARLPLHREEVADWLSGALLQGFRANVLARFGRRHRGGRWWWAGRCCWR